MIRFWSKLLVGSSHRPCWTRGLKILGIPPFVVRPSVRDQVYYIWHQKQKALNYQTLSQDLSQIISVRDAKVFADKLQKECEFEVFYRLFIERFWDINRLLELLGEEDSKNLMLFMTSGESLISKEVVKQFYSKREQELEAWRLQNDTFYRNAGATLFYVPGFSNPYDV